MIAIPADATTRLFRDAGGWCVSIIREGAAPTIYENLARPGLTGQFTHDPGVPWPDRKGVALVNALLAQPESAAFLMFANNADAVACWERLNGGAA